MEIVTPLIEPAHCLLALSELPHRPNWVPQTITQFGRKSNSRS